MGSDPKLRGAPGPIAISGYAAVTCLGADAETTWKAVVASRCGMGPMTEMESPLPPGSDGGQAVSISEDGNGELPREALYLRRSVADALRTAGSFPTLPYQPARCAAVFGTTLHGIRAGGRFLRKDDPAALQAFLAGATAEMALRGLGFGGGHVTTCSACSSSLGAIALGVTLLETGQADLVVAGGYDTISEYVWAGFNSLRVVATGPLKPFTRGRQGMKLAEGYGIVVLERAGDALRRGIRPAAIISGWGESADGFHLTRPHPDGTGASRAMGEALARSGLGITQIGMIAAHATGTEENDASEAAALQRVFGDHLRSVPIVGFKSHLGHTLGAAGAVELILSVMSLRDQCVPPCANVRADEIEFPALRISTATGPRDPASAVTATLNTSLGFGGANTSVVLSRSNSDADPPDVRFAIGSGERVVVSGFGVVLPGAIGNAAFCSRISEPWGSSADHRHSTIDDESLDSLIGTKRARRLNRNVKLTLAAAGFALEDSGIREHPDELAATAGVMATTHGSPGYCYEYYKQIVEEGVLSANPMLFAEGVPNAGAAHVSTTFGLHRGCQTIIGTRTAGMDALRLAYLRIQSGAERRVLVVAAEESHRAIDRAYEHCRVLAIGDSQSDSASGTGFRSSSGAVALVLESGSSAALRGARTYATVEAALARAAAPTRLSGTVREVLLGLGHVPTLTVANGSWIDRAERAGFAPAERSSGAHTLSDLFGELFSAAGPVTIAALLLGHQNHFLGDTPSPADQNRGFGVVCSDPSGLVSGMSFRPVNDL